MGKPKIVSFWNDSLEEPKSCFLMYVDPAEVEFTLATPDMSEDEICEAVSGATMILAVPRMPFLNRRILEAAKGVKLVKFISAGYEKIDLEAAVELGIPVANNTGVNSITVAEHTLMMILVLQRKAFMFHSEVMEGTWPKAAWGDMWELRGRTLGVLGLGAIGSELAKMRAPNYTTPISSSTRTSLAELNTMLKQAPNAKLIKPLAVSQWNITNGLNGIIFNRISLKSYDYMDKLLFNNGLIPLLSP